MGVEPWATLSFALSLVFGILASLAKITSFVVPFSVTADALAACTCYGCFGPESPRSTQVSPRTGAGTEPFRAASDPVRPSQSIVFLLGILLMAPLLVGYLYVVQGDRIKDQAPFTAWLSSAHPYHEGLDIRHAVTAGEVGMLAHDYLSRKRNHLASSGDCANGGTCASCRFKARGFERLDTGKSLGGLQPVSSAVHTRSCFLSTCTACTAITSLLAFHCWPWLPEQDCGSFSTLFKAD